jgi:hypothetical protein
MRRASMPDRRAGRVDAAHHAAGQRAAVRVEVPKWNAVLHRHDQGVGPQQMRQRRQHGLDLVRLHPEHDDVLRSGRGVVVGRRHVARDVHLPVIVLQRDAVAADRLQVGAAHQERDVLARQRKPGADEAADRTRANDCNLHGNFPGS